MKKRDAIATRLANQQIERSSCTSAGDVVARLVAIQAQDYRAALWAIGVRWPGSTRDAIERAIAERTIVRTWPMRRTLHFVAATDVRWILQLLAPRMIKGAIGRMKQLELDDAIFARSRRVIEKALRDDATLTREELYSVLERAKVSPAAQRGIHILSRLSQEGFLCFASHRGTRPTFALLDAWLPKSRARSREEALAELTLRYFRGHGPATVRDLAWWAGISLGDARAGAAMVANELVETRIDGEPFLMARDAATAPRSKPTVHLLPGFDQYLLGYTDRRLVLDVEHATAIVPGSNGVFMPTIIAGGRVVGTWKVATTRDAIVVAPTTFAPVTERAARSLAAASKRYEEFARSETAPTITPRATRPSARAATRAARADSSPRAPRRRA
jgi:hypothetical protein